MKASFLLRGRSEAFKLDAEHLTRNMEKFVKDWQADGGDMAATNEPNSSHYRTMRERAHGYRIASHELANIADEMLRAGQ